MAAPGADAEIIRLAYSGVNAMSLREHGALLLQTELGELVETAPLVYQDIDGGRMEVEGSYLLLGGGQVGFRVGAYDATYPLVIDPVLVYSTYLGGSGFDVGLGITVDADDDVYVMGLSRSADFPTANPLQPAFGGVRDTFVAKLNACRISARVLHPCRRQRRGTF